MIKLNFGVNSFPLTQNEAVRIAETLLDAAAGKSRILPSFTSGMHGHVSVLVEVPAEKKSDTAQNFSSQPVLHRADMTDC